MENLIVSIIILTIVAIAITKIITEKRKGTKCIGCPYSQTGGSYCDYDHSSKKPFT